MQGKSGTVIGIVLTILALIIGVFGVAVFIGVGEAANNALVAFGTVSFSLALLAGFLSWIAPRAHWAIAIAMSVPMAVLCVLGAWSSGLFLPGALWTVALTCAGAYLGERLRLSHSSARQTPPP